MNFDANNTTVTNPSDPWHREWGTGSVITSVVAIAIMAAILAYGATKATDTPPNSSRVSQPNTTG